MKTNEDVGKFLGGTATKKIKTLALMQAEDDVKNPGKKKTRAVIVLLRGDHSLNEAKLSTALGGKEFRPMQAEEIEQEFGSPAGYLGPVGIPAASSLDYAAHMRPLGELLSYQRSRPRPGAEGHREAKVRIIRSY